MFFGLQVLEIMRLGGSMFGLRGASKRVFQASILSLVVAAFAVGLQFVPDGFVGCALELAVVALQRGQWGTDSHLFITTRIMFINHHTLCVQAAFCSCSWLVSPAHDDRQPPC